MGPLVVALTWVPTTWPLTPGLPVYDGTRFYPVTCNRCRMLLLALWLMITQIGPSGVMPQLVGRPLLGGWIILNLLIREVMLPVVVHSLYTGLL